MQSPDIKETNPMREDSRREFLRHVVPLSLATIALPALLTGCTQRERPQIQIDPEHQRLKTEYPAVNLGRVGGDGVYIKYAGDDRMLLVIDGFKTNAVVEHKPQHPVNNQNHEFSYESLGRVGGDATYLLTVDGKQYVYVDGFNGGDLTSLSEK